MQILRVVHRWLGLLLALPLIVMGLSGALLTLEPVWPEFGPAPAASAVVLPANTVLAAAAAAAPAGMRLARYVPAQPGAAVQAVYVPEGSPRGPAMILRLDPGTAAALGPVEPASGVMNWVRRLHQNLLLPQFGGRQIAGWFGVGLLLVTLIGIPLWWPAPGRQGLGRLGAALTVPRRARGLRLHRALHGAGGAWLVLMLLATSGTGIAQGFPQTLRQVLGLPSGGRPPGPPGGGPGREAGGGPPREGRGAPGGAMVLPDLDSAIALARQALPGLEPRQVMLPQGNEPLRLMMAPPGEEGAVVTRFVTVDASGGRLLSAAPAPGAAELVLRWNHDLHEGAGLGPVWRGLTVLTGVALPVFGVTGVAMWLLKRRNRRRVDQAKEQARVVALS